MPYLCAFACSYIALPCTLTMLGVKTCLRADPPSDHRSHSPWYDKVLLRRRRPRVQPHTEIPSLSLLALLLGQMAERRQLLPRARLLGACTPRATAAAGGA